MTIDEFNFAGKKAIVRVDFNVPLDENGNVTDDTRVRGALPTLKKILADGGAVIMMSHMGKPKGKVNPKLSLGCTVVNFLNQTGTKGSIVGAELITKDQAAAFSNTLMTGSYLRPFTVEFNASLKF